MIHPPVVIVDDQDTVMGEAPLQEAWHKGLVHRVVFVVLENDFGEVLLQRRSATMRLFPNCWDISAGGHVDGGHSYLEAAYLEVEEELGVPQDQIMLEETAHFYTEEPYPDYPVVRRFVKVYRARIAGALLNPEASEVAHVEWFTKKEISLLAEQHPEALAAGLSLVYWHVFAKQLSAT